MQNGKEKLTGFGKAFFRRSAFAIAILGALSADLADSNLPNTPRYSGFDSGPASDPVARQVLLRMYYNAQINKDPYYLYEKYKILLDAGYTPDELLPRMLSFARLAPQSLTLKFINENNLSDSSKDKLWEASMSQKQVMQIKTLLSYNLNPNEKGFIGSYDKDSILFMNYIGRDEIMVLADFWGIGKIDGKELCTITEAMWRKLQTGKADKETIKKGLDAIKYLYEAYGKLNPFFVAQSTLALAQAASAEQANYLWDSKKVAVSHALMRYLKDFDKLKREPVFYDNVVLIDNIEHWSDGSDRFGSEALRARLKEKAKLYYIPEHQEQSARKRKLFDMIKKTENLTVYFDGHGSPDAIYLADGQPNENGQIEDVLEDFKISPQELAQAISDRVRFLKKLGKLNFIISACFSNDFIQKTISYLPDDIEVPVFISMSQYAQFGWSQKGLPTGSRFADFVLTASSLGDLVKNSFSVEAFEYLSSKPTVFIPRQNHGVTASRKQSFGAKAHDIKRLKFHILG